MRHFKLWETIVSFLIIDFTNSKETSLESFNLFLPISFGLKILKNVVVVPRIQIHCFELFNLNT